MWRHKKGKDKAAIHKNVSQVTGETWRILWNEYASNAYIYGSEIYFHGKEDVEFRNALMPPGTVIKRWFSKTNYQMMRVEPSLPLIDGEGRYWISLDAETDAEEEGLLLRLLYFDRYDEEVGSQIVRDGQAEFQCPLRAYSYEVQLIAAGAKQFHFHAIIISEVLDDEEKVLSDTEESE